jgi:predicted nuclease of restriction endonuclease-like (RecB) superfamily
MGELSSGKIQGLYQQIRDVLTQARSRAWQAVNFEMVTCYWEIGRLIVEEEQRGAARADYGARLIAEISKRLTAEFGKGFDRTNLQYMRSVFLNFPIRDALRRELSWTHYRLLLRVEKPEARSFYEIEAVNARWSTRELERQINSLLFQRLTLSRDKAGVMALAAKGHEINEPGELVKDPYVLEFTGIRQDEHFLEKDLESALISKLRQFLLELGKGFSFVARQKRFTLDGQHFFIDLVFYNYILKCFVLIDLKVGALTHQDLGQMQMYVNYYTRELMNEGDGSPIGIVLCSDKNDAVVRYTLPEGNDQVYASRYKLYLPTEKELATELLRERKALEMEAALAGKTRKTRTRKGEA